MHPVSANISKKLGYADKHFIPFVALVGETEAAEGKLNLKNMATGEQVMLTPSEAVDFVNKNL